MKFTAILFFFVCFAAMAQNTYTWKKQGTIIKSIKCATFNAEGLFINFTDESACKDYKFAWHKKGSDKVQCAKLTPADEFIKWVDREGCEPFTFGWGSDFFGKTKCGQFAQEKFLRWTDTEDFCKNYTFALKETMTGTTKCAKVTAEKNDFIRWADDINLCAASEDAE